MDEIAQFLWLCRMAAEFIGFPPFLIVFGLLVTNFICAYVRQRPFRNGRWTSSYWLVFTQSLFYPAVIAVAVVGGTSFRPVAEPNKAALLYVDILWWASFISGVFWIWRLRGIRWTAFSLVALQEFMFFGAYLTADMAISGRWI